MHPTTDALLRYLSPRVEWTVVQIDEHWRDRGARRESQAPGEGHQLLILSLISHHGSTEHTEKVFSLRISQRIFISPLTLYKNSVFSVLPW